MSLAVCPVKALEVFQRENYDGPIEPRLCILWWWESNSHGVVKSLPALPPPVRRRDVQFGSVHSPKWMSCSGSGHGLRTPLYPQGVHRGTNVSRFGPVSCPRMWVGGIGNGMWLAFETETVTYGTEVRDNHDLASFCFETCSFMGLSGKIRDLQQSLEAGLQAGE